MDLKGSLYGLSPRGMMGATLQMRKQTDLPAVTIIVKLDSNLPDSKSDPLPITFCFLVPSHTHLAQQDGAGNRANWQGHGHRSQRARSSPSNTTFQLCGPEGSFNLSVPPYLLGK